MGLTYDHVEGNVLQQVRDLDVRLQTLEAEALTDATAVGGVTDHGALLGLDDDDHTQYILVDGTRDFTGVVGGITPTLPAHLVTKNYVDTTMVPQTVEVIAGAGLTGGGALSASRTLDVGAGAGITVNADDVALTTPGTLAVNSVNSSVGSHTHAITSSSNPGAAAAILKTSAAGALTLTGLLTVAAGVTFSGATGANVLTAPDNVAQALHLVDAGGIEYVRIISTDTQPVVTFNDGGADVDFIVESDTLTDALVVQGSDGQITLGVLTVGYVKSDASGVLSSGAIALGDLPAGANYQYVGTGAGTAAGWINVSTLAGVGLVHATGVLAVGTPTTLTVATTNSVSGTTHSHAITSSSNPGAAAAILKTSAAGALTLTGLLTVAAGITFSGASGANELIVPDNTAIALELLDAGGIEYLRLISTNAQPIVSWNEAGVDVDFKIEGVGKANALFVQGSDGSIGIGTATPQTLLHIWMSDAGVDPAWSAGVDVTIFEGSGNVNTQIFSPANKKGIIGFSDPDLRNAGFISYDHTTDRLDFAANATTNLVLDSNGYTLVGGMTTSLDTATLQVRAVTANTVGAIVRGKASQVENLQEWQNSGGTVLAAITAGGYIGVGTTTPLGNIEASVNGANADISSTGYGVGTGTFHVRRAQGTLAVPTALLAEDILGGIGGRGYYGAGWHASSPASIHFVAKTNQSAADYGMYIRFLTTPAGSIVRSERMRIDSTGYVGINELAPTAFLHITGAAPNPPLVVLNAATNGEIATADGESLRIGHWNGVDTFTERLKMDATGGLHAKVRLAVGVDGAITADRLIDADGSLSFAGNNYGAVITPALGVTNQSLYGLYAKCDVDDAMTATATYGVYVSDGAKGAGAAIATQYGVFVGALAAGATNYAIYCAGGNSYHAGRVAIGGTIAALAQLHVDQSNDSAGIPALLLDQADISEGCVDFIASDRGVISGVTNSVASVRVELNGIVYRVALYADA